MCQTDTVAACSNQTKMVPVSSTRKFRLGRVDAQVVKLQVGQCKWHSWTVVKLTSPRRWAKCSLNCFLLLVMARWWWCRRRRHWIGKFDGHHWDCGNSHDSGVQTNSVLLLWKKSERTYPRNHERSLRVLLIFFVLNSVEATAGNQI